MCEFLTITLFNLSCVDCFILSAFRYYTNHLAHTCLECNVSQDYSYSHVPIVGRILDLFHLKIDSLKFFLRDI